MYCALTFWPALRSVFNVVLVYTPYPLVQMRQIASLPRLACVSHVCRYAEPHLRQVDYSGGQLFISTPLHL
jgi:hypothetical protein